MPSFQMITGNKDDDDGLDVVEGCAGKPINKDIYNIHRLIALRGRVSFFEFQRYFSRLPESLLYQVFNQSLSIA